MKVINNDLLINLVVLRPLENLLISGSTDKESNCVRKDTSFLLYFI